MKKFRVALYVDEMASMDTTPEEEYEKLEEELRGKIFGDNPVDFIRDVQPHQVKDVLPDLYLVDYGGMAANWMYGVTATRHTRNLIHSIENLPQTIFAIWSYFSQKYFRFELEEHLRAEEWEDGLIPANVVLWPNKIGAYDVSDEQEKIRAMLGIGGSHE